VLLRGRRIPAVGIFPASVGLDAMTTNLTWTAIVFALLSLPAWSQNGTADAPAQENKLIVLERMWNEAQVQRDSHALRGLIADRFINTEYDGEVSDRKKFLADIENPEFKPSQQNIRDVKVNLYHDTAVVTGIYQARGTYNGKPYEHTGRFTDTWISENGRWLCVASHTSLLKK
jgi:ketosteroid isomerase-like protein